MWTANRSLKAQLSEFLVSANFNLCETNSVGEELKCSDINSLALQTTLILMIYKHRVQLTWEAGKQFGFTDDPRSHDI